MATLAELAEHGIVGSARVLPVPVGTAPQPLSVDPRIELIRRERTHCEAAQFESEDDRPLHVWGPSQYPKREMCQRCTLSREWAEDPEATDVVLLAEVDRLRARVAELESERAAWRRTAHRLAGEAGLIPKSVEGEHYAVTHHAYRVGRDLPEAGAQ
ncbi:hypothetical protein [Streptomyces canus]|uniref:hypothetical protein n=1 Tax=Streptomyces canus TaxID=58343 RepID=UPI00039B03D7|nr:hypothetical protein [Streptomyces canus]